MDRRHAIASLATLTLLTVLPGCGEPPQGTAVSERPPLALPPETRAGTEPGRLAQNPEETVAKFLEAVRLGDDEAAAGMLTDLARKKTKEMNMVVSPPGSDTATYQIGRQQALAADIVQVACTWTDLDQQGKKRTDEIVWKLRKAQGNWRISGMSARIFPDRPAVELDFENPEEMLRQQKIVEQEAIERAAAEAEEQARRDSDPFQIERR